jgi:AcrR family transcriptional regulator
MAAQQGFTADDLTARARIRQAAMQQFAEHGYTRTTIRGIASAAGVSPGLLRHHYGSKEELRDAVDGHILAEIRKANDAVLEGSRRGDLGPAALARPEMKPYQAYIVRALVDGSPTMAKIFDEVVELTVPWIEQSDLERTDGKPAVDARARATVLAGMAFGVQLLSDHVSRVLGMDVTTPDGERTFSLAVLDLYSHALVSPELAASARHGIEAVYTSQRRGVNSPTQPARSSE